MKRLVAAGSLGLLAGLALGWQLWRSAPIVESAAPEVRQPDGSLVLERRPDVTARPAHQLPRGAVVERVATVTVQPEIRAEARPASVDSAPPGNQPAREIQPCSCAPVHVDLSLVRLTDGTRRVIASARGGTVVGGIDIPVESAAPPRVMRWAAGPAYDWRARAWGAAIARDIERVAFVPLPARLSAQVTHGPHGWGGGLQFTVRW